MEQLPKIVRERLKGPTGGHHPDPDLLTAFAEQALPEQERSRVLLHLSRCAHCRDVLALAVPAVTATGPIDTARPTSWVQWRVLRWGAVAACFVIVGSAVMLRRDSFRLQSAKTAAVQEEGRGEDLAYFRADQTASSQIPRQEPQSAAKSAAAEAGNEAANQKFIARARDKALKSELSPMSPTAAAAPAPPVPSPARPKQIIAGAMGAGSASGAAIGAVGGRFAEADGITGQPVADETKKAAAESRTVTDLAVLGKSSEVIEVQAAAPAVESESSRDKREAVGKAKSPSSAMLDSLAASPPVAQNQAALTQETVGQKMDRTKLRHSLVSRWTISSDGQLQHSIDSGQTWQPVAVDDKASFRALSANGPDVWVGGSAGLLYHSSDAGTNWTQVKPVSGDAALKADIAAIEFTDLLHGKITTASGESWITEDGGQSWRLLPR
jgi:hypothetical protein